MPIILRRLVIATIEAKWWVIALAAALHIVVTWIGLVLLGEEALTGEAFGYYYLTTVTTVGYGDLSPVSEAGRWFAAVWLMVGGIALFTTVLAKVLGAVSAAWRRRVEGYGDYTKLKGHTILVGHEEGRTERLIAELRADDGRAGGTDEADIVLITAAEAKPLEDVRMVRTQRLADAAALRRAGIEGAERVLVYAEDDDVTLAACLAVASLNPEAHAVAYFDDAETAALARHHCPKLETVFSPAEDLVVRATRDPGASSVLSALVSATDEAGSLYSASGEALGAPCSVGAAQEHLRAQRATLLAISRKGEAPILCMGGDESIRPEDTVFYVAKKRIA